VNGLHNIKSLTLDELKTWLKSVGEKPFRAEQIQNWLFRNQVEMSKKWSISSPLSNPK
jgi:23S rRNA (adenine2503-C2)-methyltransferase